MMRALLIATAAVALGAEEAAPVAGDTGAFTGMTLAQAIAALGDRTGDPAQGKLQFQQRCSRCHTVEEGKVTIGPYLGMVADLQQRDDLLKSILFPGADLAFGYEVKRYALSDGRTIDGSIMEDTAESVRIATPKGEVRVLKKDKITGEEGIGTSVMPADSVKGITADQMAHLLAYLGTMKTGPK